MIRKVDTLHSLLSRLAQTPWLHAWTIFWWTQTSSLPLSIVVGPARPDSDHMPLEMRILLSVAAPLSPPRPPEQQLTPTWIWGGVQQEQHALALQAGPCQASLQRSSAAAAAAGDLKQADDHFGTAMKAAAGLRQTRPQISQPPQLSNFPWFDSRRAVLRSQLRHAKLLSPYSPEFKILQRRYRGQLRRSKASGNQRDVLSLSPLLKNNPRQFWRKRQLATQHAPSRVTDTCNGYLANLTTPPAHIADQLPLPHTPQPPAPAPATPLISPLHRQK